MELPEEDHQGGTALKREAARRLLTGGWGFTQAIKRHVAPVLAKQHGLEFKDFLALDAIESGSNYPGLMCQRLSVNPSNGSRLIEELVQADLVVRRLDEQDSRRIQLVLTEKGQSVLSATRATMLRLLLRGLEGVPEEQLQGFVATLNHITSRLAFLSSAQEADRP